MQNLVCRDYSKCAHTQAHTHTQILMSIPAIWSLIYTRLIETDRYILPKVIHILPKVMSMRMRARVHTHTHYSTPYFNIIDTYINYKWFLVHRLKTEFKFCIKCKLQPSLLLTSKGCEWGLFTHLLWKVQNKWLSQSPVTTLQKIYQINKKCLKQVQVGCKQLF